MLWKKNKKKKEKKNPPPRVIRFVFFYNIIYYYYYCADDMETDFTLATFTRNADKNEISYSITVQYNICMKKIPRAVFA